MKRVAATLVIACALLAGGALTAAVPCSELIRVPPWTGLWPPVDPEMAKVQEWLAANPTRQEQIRPDDAMIRERLIPLLKSPAAPTRHWAAYVLGKLRTPAAGEALFELLETERDEAIVVAAIRALAEEYRDRRIVPVLVHFMECDGMTAQRLATWSALAVPDPALVAPAVRLWSRSPAKEVQYNLLTLGARIRDPRLTEMAIETVQTSADAHAWYLAMRALESWRDADVHLRLEAFYPETTGWNDHQRVDLVRTIMLASDDGAKEFVDEAFSSAEGCNGLRAAIAKLAVQYEVGQQPFYRNLAPLEAGDALLSQRVGAYLGAVGDWGGVRQFFLDPFRECQQLMSPDVALDRWLRLDAVLPRASQVRTVPLWAASKVARSAAVHDLELAVELLRSAAEVDQGNTNLRDELAEAEALARKVRAIRGVSIALEGDRLTIGNATDEAIEFPRAQSGRLLLLADELRGGAIVSSSVVYPKGSGRVGVRVGAGSSVTVTLGLPPCETGSEVAVRMFAYPGGSAWSGAAMTAPVPWGLAESPGPGRRGLDVHSPLAAGAVSSADVGEAGTRARDRPQAQAHLSPGEMCARFQVAVPAARLDDSLGAVDRREGQRGREGALPHVSRPARARGGEALRGGEADPLDRLLPQQGEDDPGGLGRAARASRRRGAGDDGGAHRASGRRTQDRERRAGERLRHRFGSRRRHACRAPLAAPGNHAARRSAEDRAGPHEADPGEGVDEVRPPDDPPRQGSLPRQGAEVRRLSDQ